MSSSRRRSRAAPAPTAAPAITRSATTPTRTAARRARRSSAGPRRRGRSMGCRPSTRASRSPTWASSSCRTASRTTRRSCSPTSSRPRSSARELAEIEPGDTVAVFGCGPGRACSQSRSAAARAPGGSSRWTASRAGWRARARRAPRRQLRRGDPVEVLMRAHQRDRCRPRDRRGRGRRESGRTRPGGGRGEGGSEAVRPRVKEVAPEQHPHGDNWQPGDGPSQALEWAVERVRQGGHARRSSASTRRRRGSFRSAPR